jgi:TonB-linked SusC/RagA family outer membrane protein
MLKRILTFMVVVLSSAVATFSQQLITGKVTTVDDPLGIPGVNVLIKGTSNGTVTDLGGNYSLEVTNDTCTLVFSYVGFMSEQVKVTGKTTINIVMVPDIESIGEVVVTALGIKRDEKALGYSVQKVSGDEVAEVKELDVVNALSGKVSGVNIIQADGSIGGGGSRIVIRGESSLAGNNDPLFIINGIPGSANDIAPDDIESISVLKGPAAAALYGSKAGAGVVLITSKSGKGVKGIQVEVNSNITFQSPLVLPEYQNRYGMGSGGAYSYFDGNTNDDPYWDDTKYSWGPEFDGELRPQFNGNKPWEAYPNSVKDFYETGHIFVNNLSISKGTETGNYRFSYSNTDQKGILPNNGLRKDNLGLASQFDINSKLSISANINYIRTNCENNKQVDVRYIPRGIDISALKDYWVPGLEGYQQMNYRRSDNNPYFELYENPYSYIDSKVIANVTATYDILQNLNVMGRFGTNYTNNEYYDRHAYSTYDKFEPRDLQGYYKRGLANHWDRTAEFLISYDKKFFNDFSAKASFGGTHFRKEFDKKLEGITYLLTYVDLYNLNNRDAYMEVVDNISKLERNSLYGFLNLSYKGMVFLDLTRRDDWSSTLHPDHNHFSYPSAVVSTILTEMFELPNAITFWKIRGSIAQVGNDIPNPYFTILEKYPFRTSKDGLTYAEPSDTKTDPYLKPEKTTGTEFGTDIRILNNRLGFDVTYYYGLTKNQILKTKKSETSGGQNYFTVNTGKIESKGIEVTVNSTPVKQINGITWNLQLNWSLDRSYVIDFNDTIPSKTQSVNAFLYIQDRSGQRRGTFYGKAYEKTPNGERLYSLSGDTRLTDETQLGNYNPDWMASLNNTISYKNLSVSFLFDLRYGGLIYNETERKLNMYGLSKATLLNDRTGIVPDGMVEESDGTYRKLTVEDLESFGKTGGQSGQEYWANQMEETVPENVLVDDTYLKFRELRIAYKLPQQWISKTFIKSVTVALVGRNLAVWSKVKHIDPETFGIASDKNDFGFDTKVPGYANSKMPSVRSYGFSLNCKF